MNSFLFRSAITAALGGLLFGFDTAVISGTTGTLTERFHLSPFTLGFTVFIALLGTVIGAMGSGVIGQKIGGRKALQIAAILYLLSSLGCAFAPSWVVLLCARFLGGLGIGASSVLGPVYIAELAPAKYRGRFVGMFQINIVVGILLAYLSNYLVSLANLGATEWRWELGIPALPAAVFLALLYSIPESARWLVSMDRTAEAGKVLRMMGSENPDRELKEIVEADHIDRLTPNVPVFQRKYRLPLFLAISIGMFNQLSGINAILYYLNAIFAFAGYGKASANLQAVVIGVVNLLATFLGMALVDRLGRKTLLLIGSAGTGICLAGVATVFLTHSHRAALLWLLVIYIGFFAISQGAVIWTYISEVFPTVVRSKGQSIGCSSHWIMNAALSLVFPILAGSSGGYPFVLFAVMMALQFVVVLLIYPETKGFTLEQLQYKLERP
jgi:SP family arabinose:H+ symporter-like MFS transporter